MGMIRVIGGLLVCLALGGCVGNDLQTASGGPEIVMPNTTVSAVKSELVLRMTSDGYRITRDSDYELAFDKPAQGAAALLMGSRYDPVPYVRVSYAFAPTADAVRVSANTAIITNPGSSFERRAETTRGPDGQAVQNILTNVADALNPASDTAKARARGFVIGAQLADVAEAKSRGLSPPVDHGVFVVGVTPGLPAASAGLRKGDVIERWGSLDVTSFAGLTAEFAKSEKGKAYPMEVRRGADTLNLSLIVPK